jgi:hypothetical protein
MFGAFLCMRVNIALELGIYLSIQRAKGPFDVPSLLRLRPYVAFKADSRAYCFDVVTMEVPTFVGMPRKKLPIWKSALNAIFSRVLFGQNGVPYG